MTPLDGILIGAAAVAAIWAASQADRLAKEAETERRQAKKQPWCRDLSELTIE